MKSNKSKASKLFKFDIKKYDFTILVLVLALATFGILMVYSTSFYSEIAVGNKVTNVLLKSMAFFVVGTLVLFLASVFDYHNFRHPFIILFIAALAVALSIMVLYWGTSVKGATRWFSISVGSFGITFMPSEIVKIAIIMLLAAYIELSGKNIRNLRNFLIVVFIAVFYAGLTVLQKDLSTAFLIFALAYFIMFVCGVKLSHLFISALILTGTGAGYYIATHDYALKRVSTFLGMLTNTNYQLSEANFQIMQSIYAIGTGGLKGKGFGMSELKYLRLPEANSDFIFSIIAEEFGLIGSLFLMFVFALLLLRIFKVAINAPDKFGYVIAAGTGLLIALHILINVPVALSLLPTTGVTLPFISKGGTSFVSLMFLIGVTMNISSQSSNEEIAK